MVESKRRTKRRGKGKKQNLVKLAKTYEEIKKVLDARHQVIGATNTPDDLKKTLGVKRAVLGGMGTPKRHPHL